MAQYRVGYLYIRCLSSKRTNKHTLILTLNMPPKVNQNLLKKVKKDYEALNRKRSKKIKNLEKAAMMSALASKAAPMPMRSFRKRKTPAATVNKVAKMMATDLIQDYTHLEQTLFYPNLGVYRGLSKGATSTAIATIKTSTTISAAANNYFALSWIPSTSPTSYALSYYSSASANDPYNAAASVLGGPFSGTNPGTDYRIVSARDRKSVV